MFRNPLITTLTVCTLAVALAPGQAQAQVEPFKVTGTGIVDFIPLVEGQAAHHDADGTATHLGRYHAEGLVRLDHFTGPTTAEFSSAEPVVFTAANGDELHFDYAGTVELIPLAGGTFITVWVAEFTPAAGSTGRFANAIGGSFIMTAVTEPFAPGDTDIAYAWEGSGYLEFHRGK
jgi:hypothetical protein